MVIYYYQQYRKYARCMHLNGKDVITVNNSLTVPSSMPVFVHESRSYLFSVADNENTCWFLVNKLLLSSSPVHNTY